MAKVPPWKDEAAVAERVSYEYFIWACEPHLAQLTEAANLPLVRKSRAEIEKAAVEAALQRRDPLPLAELLQQPEIRIGLAPETWDLVGALLCGKVKRKRGPRPKTAAARRAMNPVHNAGEAVPWIRDVLRRLYPYQAVTDIRDRALWIAEQWYGARAATLSAHLLRSRRDRRRV